MRRRLALLVVALFVLTACSDDGTTVYPDVQQLTQAVDKAVAGAKTAGFTTEIAVGTVQTKGQGQLRLDASTALVTTMDFYGDPLEIRLVDGQLYVKVPESAQEGDKPWVRIPRDGTDPFSQAAGGSIDQLAQQNDPARTLEQIKTAGTIVSSGAVTLNDAPTTHYVVNIDLVKLHENLPAGLSPAALTQTDGKATGFPLELWLNAEQLPVQVTFDLTPILIAAGAPPNSAAKITTAYKDWKAPTVVEPPPADQVGDLPPPP
ncbi:hypothetical protein [Amycolatopsis sp.]|uniref:hypothetical protein n=1 Tax=Amycolatopsis sp. TaxID=37632 RepID=UPI002DFDCA5A|nr:hypothetical protein [Amycolatopsis sp.]